MGLSIGTKPDKTHKEFATLSQLQSHITAVGVTYQWGSEFTVYNDGANNGDYKLTYGQDDTDKNNSANLVLASLVSVTNRTNTNATPSDIFHELVINDINSKTRKIEGVAYTNDDSNISQNYIALEAADIPNETAIVFEATATFIEGSAGSSGYAIKIIGNFVKDAGGTLAQVGTTTTSHNQEDITGTPTFGFNLSGGNLACVVNSGGSVGGRSVVEMKVLAITNNNFS